MLNSILSLPKSEEISKMEVIFIKELGTNQFLDIDLEKLLKFEIGIIKICSFSTKCKDNLKASKRSLTRCHPNRFLRNFAILNENFNWEKFHSVDWLRANQEIVMPNLKNKNWLVGSDFCEDIFFQVADFFSFFLIFFNITLKFHPLKVNP